MNEKPKTVYEDIRDQGYSRRDFLWPPCWGSKLLVLHRL
jgi:hypothetical protein